VHDEKARRFLDLRNWEAAVRPIGEWETRAPAKTLSVSEACETFLAGAEARKLREGSSLTHE